MANEVIIQSCDIEIGTEEELIKFRFGGIPEGTAALGDASITFWQKQKAKTGFFSSIGAAAEGRGREILTLTPGMVSVFETVTDRRGRLSHYNTVLTVLTLKKPSKQSHALRSFAHILFKRL